MHGTGEAMPRARRHTITPVVSRPRYGVGRVIRRTARRHHAPRHLFGKAPRRRYRPPHSHPRRPHARPRPKHHLSVQQRNAARILKVANRLHLQHPVAISGLAAAMVESKLHNLNYGDSDSLGLFQQRPSAGEWGSAQQILNPAHAAKAYYQHAKRIYHPGMAPGDLAAQVQRPRADLRGKYGPRVPEAESLAHLLHRLGAL